MEAQTVKLYSATQASDVLRELWKSLKPMLLSGHRMTLSLQPEKRSLPQNSRMWAMLADVSRQVNWHGQKLEPSEWKDVFTAALKRQKVVPGIDGGFVVLGSSTSKMNKGEMSELMELMAAFAAQHGVRFSCAEAA